MQRERFSYVFAPTHPLAPASGRITEQRFVYHMHHGNGPFPCNSCGALVEWADLEIIHLNGNTWDNAPANLAPRCPECSRRALVARRNAELATASRVYEANGKSLTLDEWARELNVPRACLLWRLSRGMEWSRVFGPREGLRRKDPEV